MKLRYTILSSIIIFIACYNLSATTTPFQQYQSSELSQDLAVPILANNEVTDGKRRMKKGLIKKWLHKIVLKKLQKKLRANREYNQYTKQAELGMILGISSFLGFWGLVAIGQFSLGGVIICGLLALASDIITIRVLSKTRNNTEAFKKERTLSIVGLIFALATGVLPLIALIIVLLSI